MSVMLFVFKDRIFLTCRVHRPVENNRPKKQRDLNNYRETTLSVCPCQENIFQLSSSPEFPTPNNTRLQRNSPELRGRCQLCRHWPFKRQQPAVDATLRSAVLWSCCSIPYCAVSIPGSPVCSRDRDHQLQTCLTLTGDSSAGHATRTHTPTGP